MGRSKVPQDARRRVQQACQPCKTSKRRCDGGQPCSRCLKQNRQRQCNYEVSQAQIESPKRDSVATRSSYRRAQVSADRETQETTPRVAGPARVTEFPSPYAAPFPTTSSEQDGCNAASLQSPVSLASSTRMMRGIEGEKRPSQCFYSIFLGSNADYS